ncbi:protein RRP6-like 2 [Carica papaya]|uniref:protein RRP6-like 2 n=1 Tax=Carica papaya TaxID=3649 RepID=UPI000B8CA25D|nr:protein RRP6-like 2 [Carica papaya]
MLQSIGSSAQVRGKPVKFSEEVDTDEAYDILVNFNDEILEQFDMSTDEFEGIRKKEEEVGRSLGTVADCEDGFVMVLGKKKKGPNNSLSESSAPSGNEELSGVKVASRDNKASATGKAKVPFHIPTIRRPQDEYHIVVNNTNQPFEHVWLARSEDGLRCIHPLEKHSVLEFVDKDVGVIEPVLPPTMESTPFKLVEEVKDLKELAAKLRNVNEFAVTKARNLVSKLIACFRGFTVALTRLQTWDCDKLVLEPTVMGISRPFNSNLDSSKTIRAGLNTDKLMTTGDPSAYWEFVSKTIST